MKGLLRRAAKVAGDWAPDAMLLAGAGGVSYGAGLVYVPAGFIVGGLLLIFAGYQAGRKAT